MSYKETKYIDLNLISGSTDTFRNALGFYWKPVDITDESSLISGENLEFQPYDYDGLASPYLEKIVSRYTYGDDSLISVIDSDAIVPNYQYPVRLYGNANSINSDMEWRTLLLGGIYGDVRYDPIYNDKVFDNNSFGCDKPYSKMEANKIYRIADWTMNDIEISYDYNQYFKNYEQYVKNLDSELLIPNVYLLKMHDNFTYYNTVGTDASLSNTLQNFVTLDGVIEGNTYLLEGDYTNNTTGEVTPGPLKTYLDRFDDDKQSILMSPLSTETKNAVKRELQNVIFASDNSLAGGADTFTVNPLNDVKRDIDRYPYYTKIKFQTDSTGELGSSIASNNFGNKLMKTIKEVFTNELDEFAVAEMEYAVNQSYYSSSLDTGLLYKTTNTEGTMTKEVDFLKLLGHIHNNFKATNFNCSFVEEDGPGVKSAMDTKGSYRFYNTINVLNVLNTTLGLIDTEFVTDLLYSPGEKGILSTGGTSWNETPIYKLYEKAMNYSETIAYRVEKIGGPPAGDGLTQNTLQNFWFLNSSDLDEFQFYDSQVKYGKDYTYKVYAYVVSFGFKYKYSDLAITKQISYKETESKPYCLEFYDPSTNEPTPVLYKSSDDYTGENATGAQVKSAGQFLADMHVNIEPSVKLVEVPLYEKTLQVLDHPPNRVDVVPHQFLNNSQKIGFDLKYEIFTKTTFPTMINSQDATYKANYMHANDMLADTDITLESASKQKIIQVYRLNKKPESITDFQDNLLASIDLKKTDDSDRLSFVPFNNKIRTNQKYYYLFRVLNSHGEYGHLTEIYEAELVNDGGFKFALFDTIFETSLGQSTYTEPAVSFKKLFQLQPNISQLTFDTTDIDFDSPAQNQLGNLIVGKADDLLWGKKFKVRLTSKKTGKKIDLNITYKLNGE